MVIQVKNNEDEVLPLFLQNSLFPFPLATAHLRGDVLMNRQSGDKKMFLFAITAPIYWRI
jgi:hypothetical protein